MKKLILGLIFIAINHLAYSAEINDVATVVSVTPIYRQISDTRQECHEEHVQEPASSDNSSLAGPIIGGIAGGILGNQIGQGNGRIAATAGGAIVGTIVGSKVANSQNAQPQNKVIQHCHPITTTRDIIDGYGVTYRYNGKEGHTITQQQPGQTIRVGITAQ